MFPNELGTGFLESVHEKALLFAGECGPCENDDRCPSVFIRGPFSFPFLLHRADRLPMPNARTAPKQVTLWGHETL